MIWLAEASEPEDSLQDGEMIVSGRGTGRITGQFTGIDIKLLTGPDQPAVMAQGAELKGKTQTVVGSVTAGDHRNVSWIQRVVADQVSFSHREGRQGSDLGVSKHAAARHEGIVPVEIRTSGGASKYLCGVIKAASQSR
ncbi:hypothetical protein SAE02_61040 [Skermanella aerolata]|uniref:Uncharacterized protein n=1 Tax=Skermanella aerolata TaxID=393310 RepID=A0A512DZQ0_9PROT|nr:hypothetical protein N826_25835 [Skermanella aerolata KACC 11604]GEO41956.1 hypothetical protein SAE02_61040 [Skermanella aerolata]